MCGIAGSLDPRATTPGDALLRSAEAMANAIAYRGPDDHGAWVDAAAGVALAHRRLAILDLSQEGHQPMASSCGRFVMVYNGEVYNYREIRRELDGEVFRGESDTEVMLAAIRRFGLEAAVQRFIGMFAFALWDREARVLHLVRDRLGIKPLYYGQQGSTVLFGSELKALRAHPAWAGQLDRSALAAYLRYTYVPTPHSIYQDVHKLPPGTMVAIDRHGSVGEPRPFWSARRVFATATPIALDEADAATELEALLGDAVRLRMISDVPIGAFLSGGIDSSLIVALMQKQATTPVRTFTIGSSEASFNEAHWARQVAAHLGTDHTELIVTSREALDVIPDLPRMCDEPFADSSQIPTYLVARLARRHVTVALSGDGGDELFGGYPRYHLTRALWRATGWMPARLRQALAAAMRKAAPLGRLPRLAADYLSQRDWRDLYVRLVSHWREPGKLVVGAEEAATVFSNRDPVTKSLDDEMMYLDLVSYLPDDILTKVDRASMSVSLEARVPMLDHRVVAFAARLPQSMKMGRRGGKHILRRILARHVPPALFERGKMGFAVPIGLWLRGPLRDWAESLLDAKRLEAEGVFASGPIRQAWDTHLRGRQNLQHPLWIILMFQAWREAPRQAMTTEAPGSYGAPSRNVPPSTSWRNVTSLSK